MGAITPTKKYAGEYAGAEKVKVFSVVPASASDTIDLSTYFDTIHGVSAHLNAGEDANLLTCHAEFAGTTVTLVTKDAAGGAATDWTGARVTLTVHGTDEGI